MERSVLENMLSAAPGVSAEGDEYRVDDEHQLAFYLGESGRAMAMADIRAVTLADGFVKLKREGEAREARGDFFFAYDSVQGIAVREERRPEERRAGFA